MNFWTVSDADVAPPFVLAEQGYDVWLGNNRGTRYSMNHMTLDPKSAEFWRFSQEELGLGDLPAFIDYILDKTGQEKLTYIGHSMGTTQMFVAGSLNPDYFREKVNLFVGLGPIATLSYDKTDLFHKSDSNWRLWEYVAYKLGAFNLFNANWMEEDVA